MDLNCKIVSSMEKVLPSGAKWKPLEQSTLSGLRGETLSFQVAYRWDRRRKAYGAWEVISPLKDCARVRVVKLIPCEYPCHIMRDDGYLATEPGLYPDLLEDIGPLGFPLVSGQWRSLWVDLEISEDQAPGIYPVTVHILLNGEVLGAVSLNIEVINARLPKLHVPRTEWFHCDCLADYYQVPVFSEAHWKIMEAFVADAVKHKCNMLLTPVFTPPLDTGVGMERPTVQLVDIQVVDGGYVFGFEKFRRWVEMARRCGVEYFEISHLFTQWGAYHAPKVMATKDGVYQRIFGWETEASGPEYAGFLHQFLTALKRELEDLGLTGNTYFHVSDEPNMDHLKSYQSALNIVAEDLKDYPIVDTLSDYAFYKLGLVRNPICGLDHLQPFLEEDRRPAKLWGYYCTAQCVDVSNRYIVLPGFRTRILGTQMFKYSLDGFLHWGYNFYNSDDSLFRVDPFRCTDSACSFPAGDPFLVYPGPDGKPLGSQRLMLMDEAMSDLCAMKLLEDQIGHQGVMDCVESDARVEFDRYPQSAEWLLSMRERINRRLKEVVG